MMRSLSPRFDTPVPIASDSLHILLGPSIPLIMLDLLREPKVASSRVEVACHDVERDSALC
jgi:hypothetical protein